MNNIFEENQSIENSEWYYEDGLTFETEIKDTSKLFNVFLNVRHSTDFEYANLWLKIHTTFPDGSTTTAPLNLPMADESGKWFGSGLGSTLSNKILIQQNAFLEQKGSYQFKIDQDMRENPLLNIIDIGFIIERSPAEK